MWRIASRQKKREESRQPPSTRKRARSSDTTCYFKTKDCRNPNKLRRSADRSLLIAVDESKKGPHLFVVDRRDPKRNWRIDLPATPDELRVTGKFALATCAEDWLAWVDYHRGRVISRWDAEEALRPGGNKPEDAHLVRDGKFAVCLFPKRQ